jgi:hypothetical protein
MEISSTAGAVEVACGLASVEMTPSDTATRQATAPTPNDARPNDPSPFIFRTAPPSVV